MKIKFNIGVIVHVKVKNGRTEINLEKSLSCHSDSLLFFIFDDYFETLIEKNS